MELIEREPHLALLSDAWRQARAGKGRLALVSGEAGIGKTSLVARFAAEQARGTPVLWGACDALFSPQPMGPFIDIALHIQAARPALRPTGTDRLTFSTEFFIYLQQHAVPTIVVVEDLHWADEATLDVVKFLGRRVQLTKTLLILTYRDDEANAKPLLASLLGDFPTHTTTRLALPLLSREAVDRLGQRANRRLEGLYHVTGGNPFFVTEIIASDSEGVPPSVRDAVLARVARLSPAAKQIAELVSLLPGQADEWLIQAILQPGPEALDEVEERGILQPKPGALAFRHELARQSVEDSLPVGRTRDLHGRILAALLARQAPVARLVHHALRAGDEEATLRFAPEAARQASSLGAHREAASLYRAALRHAHRLTLAEQADLLDQLSFEYYLIDDIGAALTTREQASRLWQTLERPERAGDSQRWLSRLHWAGGNKQAAEQHADAAIAILSALPPSPALAMAFSNKSQLHMLAWENEPAFEWGNRAIALAEQLDAVEILVHALTNVASAGLLADFEAGEATIERALRLATERQWHDHAARCYSCLASSAVQTHLYARAQHWLEAGLEYTTARDVDLHSVYLRGWQAQLFFETGRWAEAEATAFEALRLSRAKTISPIPALTTLGHLKVRQGDAGAQAFLDQALALALPTGELQRTGPLAAARAEAAWQRGDQAQVAAEVEAAYAQALTLPNPWMLGLLAYWRWRAGTVDVPLERLAEPFATAIRGEWRQTAEAWERLGCPFERALALAEGDEPAQHEALGIFERLGARPAAEALRAKLQAKGVKLPRPGTRPLNPNQPDELTPRELEVLRLMAEGLSNPALAEKLTISVGTVKAHTASIYGKLGVNNRVLAVARARERGLV